MKMADPEEGQTKQGKRIEIPLDQYFRDNYEGMVQMAGEFEKELGKERVLAIAERMNVERSVARLRRKLASVPHESLEDFVSYHDGIMGADFTRDTQSGEKVEVAPTKFVFVMRECHWAKTFRELGAADLGYALNCSSDFEYARCFNPKLRLARPKTLMRGDDCCEFIYTWEE